MKTRGRSSDESPAGLKKRHPGARNALLTRYSLAHARLTYGYNNLEQTFADEITVGDSLQQAVVIRRRVSTLAKHDLWTRKNLNS
ncbi:hypothetical protein AAGS40_05940 [Paraburkholderia sp. PREW-6R]|uniref:hypothetical protein n=1 Tax=Paraburkholderia sp. PREW-6R TaxID=3141544 RepID=UPI0031F47DC0